jgi:hypothetical protein
VWEPNTFLVGKGVDGKLKDMKANTSSINSGEVCWGLMANNKQELGVDFHAVLMWAIQKVCQNC